MNSKMLLSAAAAAMIMAGCGGGGSSSSSTTELVAPSFATETVEVNSTTQVVATTAVVNSVIDTTSIGLNSATKKPTHTLVKDKVLASKTGSKKVKSGFELRVKSLTEKVKSTMATVACDAYDYSDAYNCTESGSVSYTSVGVAGDNPNECIYTYKFNASNCHDKYEYTYSDGSSDAYDYTANGSYTYTDKGVKDADGYVYYVESTGNDNAAESGNELYTEANGTAYTWSYQYKSAYTYSWTDGYTLDAGVFTYLDKTTFAEKGTVSFSYLDNAYGDFVGNYQSDISGSFDYSGTVYAQEMSGYIDMTYTLDGSDQHYAMAMENLKITDDWSTTSGTDYLTINGKVGTVCTGGLIAVNTSRTIVDNWQDIYELPNDGLMSLTGDANTTASLEYYQDVNGTHAIATAGGLTKTYDTYSELQGEACQGEFLNPMGGM